MMLTLLLFTVFLYGCGGSAGVKTSELSLQMLDVTSKATIEDVQVLLTAPDPSGGTGAATQITRQLATDSRGKVVFSDLPPDRTYTIGVAKDGYVQPAGTGNDSPQFIPAIPSAGLILEQGATYTMVGYLRRSTQPTTGTVKGYVYERLSGKAITSATVWIPGATATDATIIDTTDKSSKPGYFELNDVPSGQRELHVTAAGYETQTHNIVVPSGGTLNWDDYMSTALGTIRVSVRAQNNENIAGYSFTYQVLRNGTEIVKETSSQSTMSVSLEDIPTIPSGSTDTYTIKVISDYAYMVNPANGITGVVLRPATESTATTDKPTVDAGTIIMGLNKGTVNLTIFHDGTATEQTNITSQATNASISVIAASCVGRYTGVTVVTHGIGLASYYFTYVIDDVPMGNQTVNIFFPGQSTGSVAAQVWKDQTTKVMWSF